MRMIHWDNLADRIAGDVMQDDLDCIQLATDASIFYRRPVAVVYPKTTADVVETVRFAGKHDLSLHPRGAGSGLCGSALGTGIVVDFTRYMNRLIDLDIGAKTFTCDPGYRLGELDQALSGTGLFFPPDPSSGEYASFGGMVSTNASGAHSVKYGNVSDYLIDARVVLSTGRVISFGQVGNTPLDGLPARLAALADLYMAYQEIIETTYPRVRNNVAGYNLRKMVDDGRLRLERLFCGAEGTLGIATRLTFRLLDRPVSDSLVVAFFHSIEKAALAVQSILPMEPAGIEVMDKSLLALARSSDPLLAANIPDGIDNVLMVEFDGDDTQKTTAKGLSARSMLLEKGLCKQAHLAVSQKEKDRFWAVRKAAVPILYRRKGKKKILALVEDAVVPTDRLVEYFSGLYDLFHRHGVQFVLYGHIAKGLLHSRPLLDLKDPADVKRMRPIADDVFHLVTGLGGVVSGEHGDGRLRSTYIERQYPTLYPLFLRVKELFDAHNMMNPEIKTRSTPDQMAHHLRYGEEYRTVEWARPQLCWPDGWHEEIEMCHGCTKCTTVTTATRMCPIYKFTRREEAAPKAKANLLRALISGAVNDAALYEKSFQRVMDQCVNCGSCRIECPSNVDIPKMALEARARYVERFGPSLHSRLVTGVEILGRYGGRLSGRLQPLMDLSFSRKAGELVTGLSHRGPTVNVARRSLYERVQPENKGGKRQVLYFAGCYAGYMRPAIGQALIKTLRRLDITVHLPPQHCCGLPLLTKGMAGQAREKVRRNLKRWQYLLDRVDHIVVTCSSCGLALAEEWRYLLDEPRIHLVAEKMIHASRLIGPLMDRLACGPVNGSVAYHLPCHLKVQTDPMSSAAMLEGIPQLTVHRLNSHCCGMAGAWGMAAKNDGLSRTIGSHLMDLVERSDATMAATDCPTCEMQLDLLGDRPVCHPIEIVAKSVLSSQFSVPS